MIQTTSLAELVTTYGTSFEATVEKQLDGSVFVTGREGRTLLLVKEMGNKTSVLYESGHTEMWPAYVEDIHLRCGGDGRRLVGQLLHRH